MGLKSAILSVDLVWVLISLMFPADVVGLKSVMLPVDGVGLSL